jgi:hypothetical protein
MNEIYWVTKNGFELAPPADTLPLAPTHRAAPSTHAIIQIPVAQRGLATGRVVVVRVEGK